MGLVAKVDNESTGATALPLCLKIEKRTLKSLPSVVPLMSCLKKIKSFSILQV